MKNLNVNDYSGMSVFRIKSKSGKNCKNSLIQINKNMKIHSPKQKMEKIKNSSFKLTIRKSVSKIAKSTIIQTKKKIQEWKYEEKFKKLAFRQGKKVEFI